MGFVGAIGMVLVFFLISAAPARAAFEETGAGARAPGLGDAFTALADDVYSVHYNPAGLAQLDGPELGVAYARLYEGLSDGSEIGTSQLAYAHPLPGGRRGTLGLGWERFSLSGLYTEQTLALSYGRGVLDRADGGRLLAGVNVKQLSRSFGSTAEAANACRGLNCGQGVDPLLSGSNSRSALDADVGLLYRFPKDLLVGLSIKHLLSPNVAFSGTDNVERSIDAGLAYKTLWMSLVGELKLGRSSAGSTKRDMVVAAERFLATPNYGQFGLRGALGVGGDDWKRLTVGGSYRISKVQFDYAFLIPVGGVRGQSGSHRMALMVYFGAPAVVAEEGRKRPDYGYEYGEELKPRGFDDPRLSSVQAAILQGRYRSAQRELAALAKKRPLGAALLRQSGRLDTVVYHYDELPALRTAFDRALLGGLNRFLFGEDRLAMLQVSYALSMKPEDARLGKLVDDMEKALGLKAERLAADNPRPFLAELLHRSEFAGKRGNLGRSEALLSDVLALEPEHVTALERLGSVRYQAGRYAEAVAAWEAAMKVETEPGELESLRRYIRMAKERGGAGKVKR